VDRIRSGHADRGGTAVGPLGKRHRWRALRRGRPARPAARGSRRIWWRLLVSPFKRVIIDQTSPKIFTNALIPIFRVRQRVPPWVQRISGAGRIRGEYSYDQCTRKKALFHEGCAWRDASCYHGIAHIRDGAGDTWRSRLSRSTTN